MRYRLSEIAATRSSATLRFAASEAGIGILVIRPDALVRYPQPARISAGKKSLIKWNFGILL